ncbi:MAG TPA: hypothetical protein VHO66_05965, partial [Ruminiclostridium sp.]|nr:hypothetical protein [Ruminiclostridium sp.]
LLICYVFKPCACIVVTVSFLGEQHPYCAENKGERNRNRFHHVVKKFINYIKHKPMKGFAYYRLIVGVILIILALVNVIR